MKKRILAAALAMTMLMSLSPTVMAASKPKSIDITGKKSVYVGKTIELDTKISPRKSKVRDSRIVWSSSNSSVAKVLDKKDDDTKIKGMKSGTAVITVRIKGTEIKDTHKVTVKKAKKTKSSTSADTAKLESYRKNAEKIKSDIKEVKLADTFSERRNQYYGFEKRIDAIDKKLDRMDDKWEDKYDYGKISRSTYRSMERKIEQVEDYLETVEDYLDEKFNYEFDD